MSSHPPSHCCTVGVRHEGEATGKIVNVGDTPTYFAHPAQPTDKAILILTDVIGHTFINAQLIADQFAANGFHVAMPDLFHGDPLPLNRGPDFDFKAWISKHTLERVEPVVSAAVAHLRSAHGAARLGAVGYCFGAKYVARYMAEGRGVDVGYMAHPSFVEADEISAIKGPLSIAAAETDAIFPDDKRHETEKLLKGLGAGVPWQINLYSGVEHGFAIRADVAEKSARFAKEAAFEQAVTWFKEFL